MMLSTFKKFSSVVVMTMAFWGNSSVPAFCIDKSVPEITAALEGIQDPLQQDKIWEATRKILKEAKKEEYVDIINTLASVPIDRLDSVLQATKSLFAENAYWSPEAFQSLIGQLANVPVDRFDFVMRVAQNISIYEVVFAESHLPPIKTLAETPLDQEAAIVEVTQVLASKNSCYVDFFSHILRALANVPSDRWVPIVKAFPAQHKGWNNRAYPFDTQVAKSEWSYGDYSDLIDALDKVPSELLESYTQLKSLPAPLLRYVIRNLPFLPPEEIPNFITIAVNSHNEGHAGFEQDYRNERYIFGNFFRTISSNPEQRQRLRDFWIEIMRGADIKSAEVLRNRIISDLDCLELDESDPLLVDLALRLDPEMKAALEMILDPLQRDKVWKATRKILQKEVLKKAESRDYVTLINTFSSVSPDVFEMYDGLNSLPPIQLYYVVVSLPYLPPEQIPSFISGAVKSYADGDKGFAEYYSSTRCTLSNYFIGTSVSPEQRQRLTNFWIEIMRGADENRAKVLSNLITEGMLAMGLYEGHLLVDWAIRVQAVMADGNERSPYVIFEKMKAKRDVPVEWEKLPVIKGSIDGLYGRLNLEALAKFGQSLQVDFASVPSLKSADFGRLLTGLVEAREQDVAVKEDTDHIARDLDALIQQAQSPGSHLCSLMNSDPKNLPASQLKCVVNSFLKLQDTPEKWTKFATFLAGVRHCDIGQNTAIQDWYMGLPGPYRLKAKEGSFDIPNEEMPVFKALHRSIESAVSCQFSQESLFMKTICGISGEEDIEQASHQINWAKGMIGDRVGLNDGPRFDINAGTIYLKILNMPVQEMLGHYYEGMTLDRILPVIKTAFDREMKADPPLYARLMALHTNLQTKKPNIEHHTDWIEDDEDCRKVTGISPKGLARVLSCAGIFVENDGPLPWSQ